MVVVWSEKAILQLQKAYEYIHLDSPQNARKVRDEIVLATEYLVNNPNKFPKDKYKKENDGSYRAFELHRYRIAYRVNDNYIRIIRVRHTSMSPLAY